MQLNTASRMANLNGAATREILKLTQDQSIISFAGGMPAKDCLPESQIRCITDGLLSGGRVPEMLLYGTTDGLKSTRDAMSRYVKSFGIQGQDAGNIIMTGGGQQVLDLSCKAFLNKGDVCLVENPTYLTMLQILKSYEADAVGIASGPEGLDIDDLESKIKKHKPKMLYIVPTFSNPTGKTYSESNRIKIAEITAKYNVIVLEDDPYSKLRFEGEEVGSIKGLTNADNIIFATSFSKIISPGLRIGFACAHKDIIRKLEICKQGVDVHTPNLNQAIAEEFVNRDLIRPHLERVMPLYKAKKDFMNECIDKYMPKEFKYNKTQGGLFIWGEFTNGLDTFEMFPKAINNKVAYVYGQVFYADGKGLNTLRLNFSNAATENIEKGIKALGDVFSGRL